MSCWALVPVKARRECKTRLADVLSPDQRLWLVRRVLAHVLATLRANPRIDHVAIVSSERDDVPASIDLLPEEGHDLNSSLTMAMAAARARGASTILILHADLPDLSTTDIDALLDGAGEVGIAIAPDDRGEGTNGLLLPSCVDFPLQFGSHSFAAHLANARARGFSPTVVRTPGLGFDLDNSVDFEQYNKRFSHAREHHQHNWTMN